MAESGKFTAAMVQMRTSLLPEPSLEQATGLIREAIGEDIEPRLRALFNLA